MDFEAMIRDAQKAGLTVDDIAKQFSNTLNAVQQEDQRKKKANEDKEYFIEGLKDRFNEFECWDSYDEDDAAAFYTIVMAKKHPNWGIAELKDFNKGLNDLIQIYNKVSDAFDNVLGSLFGVEDKDESDDEKLSRFLKNIGL